MNPTELSTCFCTDSVKACRDFYQKYLGAEIAFFAKAKPYINQEMKDGNRPECPGVTTCP